ncbi:hypothetical protein CN431_13495 [Bacillus cereus]|nr:hypothetical protein CN431_13495 [Bacillus cereus]
MQVKYHEKHVTITGDEDILQRAGIAFEASKLRKGEMPTTYEELRYFYERAYKKKTKNDAILYVIARENYVSQNDHRDENKRKGKVY